MSAVAGWCWVRRIGLAWVAAAALLAPAHADVRQLADTSEPAAVAAQAMAASTALETPDSGPAVGATLAGGSLAPAPAAMATAPVKPWQALLQTAAAEAGVDADLLAALVSVESNFNPRVISRFGAVGLMQIMPATAAVVGGLRGTRAAIRAQLQDPLTNLRIGALHVHQLMERFTDRLDLVLAAYNAGVGNVLKAGGRVPHNRETPGFVQKVSQRYEGLRAQSQAQPVQATAASQAGMGWTADADVPRQSLNESP